MSQALMAIDEVGNRRTGGHKGGKRQKYFLSDADRNLIRAVYANPEYGSVSESVDYLMAHFHAPRTTVKGWASKMGLARTRDDYWTDGDIAYLQEHYQGAGPRSSTRSIAKRLGRTEIAVKLKAKRLRFHRAASDSYTARSLADALGCSDRTVRRWIDQDMLRATWKKTSEEWDIDSKDIRQFIIRYPSEIDPRRSDWLWLLDILVGEKEDIGKINERRGRGL